MRVFLCNDIALSDGWDLSRDRPADRERSGRRFVQEHGALCVIGVGEHVKGIADLRLVAEPAEYLDIPRLRFGIAGDVDDTVGGEPGERLEEGRGAPRPGRVDEGDVDVFAVLCERFGVVLAVGGDEADILDTVELCVALGVCDSGWVQLYGVDGFRVSCGDDADGAYPAVGVKNGLSAAELCELDRFLIELFRLIMVDLVERRGGDDESFAAQDIGDTALAEEDLALLAREELLRVAVDGTHGGGERGTSLLQGCREGALGGEDGVGAVDDRHDLVCADGFTDHHALEPPSARVGVVGHDLEAEKQLAQ